MPGRTTLTQIVNLGVETTPGTAVAANKRMSALNIAPAIQAEVSAFRPSGHKAPTVMALNREWSSADVSGAPTYSEIIYPLSSILTTANTVTQIMDGATPTTAYTWTFQPATTTDDTPKTYTIEVGSAARAQRFDYGLFTAMGLDTNRAGISMSGTLMGQETSDGVTLTASPTAIELVPILPGQVDIFLDATSVALGTTKLTRALALNWSIGSRFNPVWVLDSQQGSWVTHIEAEPVITFALTLEADATGMGLLANLRAGDTRFLRYRATGPRIYSGGTNVNYSATFDFAGKVESVSPWEDRDGLYAITWTFRVVHDVTWGRMLQAAIINKLSAL